MSVSELVGKGLYSPQEAAHILGIPAAKLRRWMFGYTRNGKTYESLWKPEITQAEETLSFYDLLELKLVNEFSSHGLALPIIRQAAKLASEEFNQSHPFIRQKFHTDGKRIFLEAIELEGDNKLVDTLQGQFVIEKVLRPSFIQSIEYSDLGDAKRWFPVENDKSVVLDPTRSFGKPILDASGLPTQALYEAYTAGDSLSIIANSYGISKQEVNQAILYESQLQEAA